MKRYEDITVLIIGLGSIARKHIAALNALGVRDIYALRRPGSSRKTDIKGVKEIYDPREATALAPDFVIISNPTSEHAATIEFAATLGCPLFIEKPLGAALPMNLPPDLPPSYVACNLRHLGSVRFLKAMMEHKSWARGINEVNVYCGSYLPDWRPGTDFRQCYSANATLGGGAHLDLIHELDYCYWLFGMPPVVRATLRSRSTLGIDAVDYANYLLEYDRFCANVTLNYYRRDYRRTIEIVAEDTTITADLGSNTVVDASGRELYKGPDSIADTYTAQMRYFIDEVLRGRSESMNSIDDATNVLKIALQNVES